MNSLKERIIVGSGALILAITPLVWPSLKKAFDPDRYVYKVFFFNGKQRLQNVKVIIRKVSDRENSEFINNSDIMAKVSLSLEEGDYLGKVEFNKNLYPFQFSINKSNLNDTIDISRALIINPTVPNTSETDIQQVDTIIF